MKLREALAKRKFLVTTEIQAPIDEEPEGIVKTFNLVRGRVDGVSVSEVEIEGIVGDTIKTCEVLKQNRFEAIYQTSTRQKNRLQLQKDLILAHEAGVENLLVFTEDYRITGDSLQEIMFFHVDSGKLASVLEHIREGRTVDGKELPYKAEFILGSGVESCWGKNVPELEMKEMEEMTRIGTGYFLTTPVFDLDRFEKFVKTVGTFGVPVIAEVMILRTAGMGRFLNRHFKSGLVPEWIIQKLAKASDKQKASIYLFADIVTGIKDICQGIHIITIGGEEKLRYYLDAAKLR
ncbi:MAG: methylenetetrahydrofolate reductase [Deltaproteobacteria bacterium CG12_big_fil_rev_8_21_14_0_65_43_10]|nr:MAG: methylenetetrahydrofolate reductase [Deltaproteobacteria bacterium CG2_30_43_15]PIQ46259.1 MAG: methylenetetrahydrofolate reductase [Deltaproteobacteria bacterium CG12_big_fil_rev_8_21_14_0_65_43_10]PIU85496.1 MAG: methylenetetrahydrofolate reductase [Deltaproteobacteria bacterium CG06_land_8_20_14_3_00_44_19]PIX24047.1 MAG: methylenetetrahydrofolate reductase [Deltaproteobacteria bacterium CG_4_8_14_3_um_filter_43_13]PIZ20072.1 MAG: methylenetetrahydrofolate reductase [Deltaproteobacte